MPALEIIQILNGLLARLQFPMDGDAREPLPAPTEDPRERILRMRKIKGNQNSGFARLYGAKDVEQFLRQAQYMADFADTCPAPVAAVCLDAPTYADLSAQQLRFYFTWRVQIRRGIPLPCDLTYALVYFSELLNGITASTQTPAPEEIAPLIATAWLALRGQLPALDMYLTEWFKDFYLCQKFDCAFADLVEECGLRAFYPMLLPLAGDANGVRQLLESSGHHYRRSKFFLERPDLCALLEEAFPAVLANLAPLFTLSGISLGEAFAQTPDRFYYYELFKGAAVRPPQALPNREVRLSHNDIYRCHGGNWSRAYRAEGSSEGGGNPAVGCIVRRMEAVMREVYGYRYKLSPVAAEGQLERWLRSEGLPPAMHAMLTEDRIFATLVDETTRQVCQHGGALPGDGLVAHAHALQQQLAQEPYKSILRMQKIPGGNSAAQKTRQFRRQGELLARLEDTFNEEIPCPLRQPTYDQLRHDQLRYYLHWRSAARQGVFAPADRGYVYLYCQELLFGIGTKDAPGDLFRLLRHAAALDRPLERRLPGWIFDLWVTGDRAQPFAELVQQHAAAPWYPALFLHVQDGREDILPLWNQLATYKILQSRFYAPEHHAALNGCFCAILAATERTLTVQERTLESVLFTRFARQPNWFPFEGLGLHPPAKLPVAGTTLQLGQRERFAFHGHEWVTHSAAALTPMAAPLAGWLLKSMELHLRRRTQFPYKMTMTAGDKQQLAHGFTGEKELLELLLSDAFSELIRC
ncbi:MAG: TerB N-terminal domain-containing protein, partial [Oscillospiraceae bacterium]|nr:TerB N-terminal domain-containing protein [Oscillospiraceae bacterium]